MIYLKTSLYSPVFYLNGVRHTMHSNFVLLGIVYLIVSVADLGARLIWEKSILRLTNPDR